MGFYDALARRGAAKLANIANLEPGPAKGSQDSQDSQGGQPAAIAEVEAELARTARAAGLPFDRLRTDPDGIRDVDIEWFSRNWRTDCGRPLARAYLEAVAFRLAVDPLPIVAPVPKTYEKRNDQ